MRYTLACATVLASAVSLAACGADDATCGSEKTMKALQNIVEGNDPTVALDSAAQEVGGNASGAVHDVRTLGHADNAYQCEAFIVSTATTKDGRTTTNRSPSFQYQIFRTDAGKMRIRVHGL